MPQVQRELDVITEQLLSYENLFPKSLSELAAALPQPKPDNELKDIMYGRAVPSGISADYLGWAGSYYLVLSDGMEGIAMAPTLEAPEGRQCCLLLF